MLRLGKGIELMNIMKSTMYLILCGGFIAHSNAMADNKYWQEFKQFRENPSYNLLFDRDVAGPVKEIARNLENAKKVGFLDRWDRPVIDALDGVIVTQETMPALYGYIETLCKENKMQVPVVLVAQHKGMFNAFAQKIYRNSGSIFIGQDLLKDLTALEVEAIVAHEIGHIKHDHINKMVLLAYARMFVLYQLCSNEILTFDQCLWIQVLMPYFLIGKRFEREADEFACREGHRADGIASSFEYLLKKEKKRDASFDELYTALEGSHSEIDLVDRMSLWTSYYTAKGLHNLGSGIMWLYHNTPLGAHPSFEERIANAKRIMAEQAAVKEAPATEAIAA